MNKIRLITWGALVAAVAIVVYLVASPSTKGYTVYAEFHDVDGLRQGATVKVAGVPAGLVTKLVVTPQGDAMVTMTLDRGAAPIGQGASVEVRPTDLLGEHYAQLDVGNLRKPLPTGSLIPMSRTSVPVELDQVLDTLDTPVRARLRILIEEAGVALAGRGANFNQLLTELPPSLSQAQAMLGQVSDEDATLSQLIDAGDQVTSAVDDKRQAMGTVITRAEEAMHSVAIKQQQLGETVDNAPSALSQLHTTLTQLDGASAAIIPAANELQQTASPLVGTLDQLSPLSDEVDPTLVTARKVAPALERLGRDGRGPLEALRPTAGDIKTIAGNAAPIIGELNSRAIRDILWFVENWALATKGRDDLGNFVGADLEIDPSIITSAAASLLSDGSKTSTALDVGKKPTTAHSGTPASSKPTLGSTVTTVTKSAGSTLSSTLSKVGQTVGGLVHSVGGGLSSGLSSLGKHSGAGSTSTTSSSSSSVQSLLKYLLGS